MKKERLFPDYIFESSWEVCNKVGGIYAVLSTRAKTLKEKLGDRLIFIGPDCWGEKTSPYFEEDKSLFSEWQVQAAKEGINVKIGRWTIPGSPVAILVDFNAFYPQKDTIYTQLWNKFHVDSLHAYGDYDEASMFAYAAARVVESFYNNVIAKHKPTAKVVYHGNEWMTGLGVLYIHDRLPQVATIFTTHATSIGRSIAGNTKPLFCTTDVYDYGTSKVVGREQEHIKLELVDSKSSNVVNGIAFGQSASARYIKSKRSFDIAYTIEDNIFKRNMVQLQIEDIRPAEEDE